MRNIRLLENKIDALIDEAYGDYLTRLDLKRRGNFSKATHDDRFRTGDRVRVNGTDIVGVISDFDVDVYGKEVADVEYVKDSGGMGTAMDVPVDALTILSEGTSTIRDEYVYIIYDFKRECYDAAYGWEIFDDLRWNNVMLVGGPYPEMSPKVEERVEELQSREREEWDYYHGLNESQGVVERGYDKFAEYLWQRCTNCDVEPDERGEIYFTIPAPEWAKFNTYGLSTDTMDVCICDSNNAKAMFGYGNMKPTVFITRRLIESGRGNFIETVMHELTHSVNKLANAENPNGVTKRMGATLRRHAAKRYTLPDRVQYLYTPTEINARLTQAYYWLSQRSDYYKKMFPKYGDSQNAIFNIFNDVDVVTRYSEMLYYIDKIDKEEFTDEYSGVYQKETPKNTPLMHHLKFNDDNAHKNAVHFPTFFKNRLKIKGYMQQECEKFKKRIDKMIYKFITDYNIG